MTKFAICAFSTNVKNVKKKNVNVVYSGHALTFEIASLGMPLKHRKIKKIVENFILLIELNNKYKIN